MFLSTLERQPPSNIQFKEAFPPHKSPTRPLLLVPVFGEEYKYSYVLFVQLPFKIGILSLAKRQNLKGWILAVWPMQLASAVSCSFDSWSDPSLKLPRIVGELNRCTCHLALSLPLRLIVFSPLFCGRTYRFQCLGVGHKYLKLFITLASHWSKYSFLLYIYPSLCNYLLACCLLLFSWLERLSSQLLYSAQFSSCWDGSQGPLFFLPCLLHIVCVIQDVNVCLLRQKGNDIGWFGAFLYWKPVLLHGECWQMGEWQKKFLSRKENTMENKLRNIWFF